MPKFKITYVRAEPGQPLAEEVRADFFSDVGGDWIEFLDRGTSGLPVVRRVVRRSNVARIELLDAPTASTEIAVGENGEGPSRRETPSEPIRVRHGDGI
jgi:hypothetical protein